MSRKAKSRNPAARQSGAPAAPNPATTAAQARPDAATANLSALRARIERGAAYAQAFDGAFKPYQIPAGMICLSHADAATGLAYLRLAEGRADAPSMNQTGGYSVRLPDSIEAAASGRRVAISVIARAAGARHSRFALAYSTNDVGNSGWRWQDAGPDWAIHTMEYDVPAMNNGNGDFLGVLPDVAGQAGVEICCVAVRIG